MLVFLPLGLFFVGGLLHWHLAGVLVWGFGAMIALFVTNDVLAAWADS